MKFVLLIIGLVCILFLMKPFARTDNGDDKRTKPAEKIPNDKIVIVKGASAENIKQTIRQFCNLYNSEELSAIVNVSEYLNGDIVITFPYNIDFGRFCFFVNYMYYPNKLFYKADIKGWASARLNDMWIRKEAANKKVMLYIPPGNTEYDSLYMTTEDGIGYKIAFGDSGEPRVIVPPVMPYQQPQFRVEEINTGEEIV